MLLTSILNEIKFVSSFSNKNVNDNSFLQMYALPNPSKTGCFLKRCEHYYLVVKYFRGCSYLPVSFCLLDVSIWVFKDETSLLYLLFPLFLDIN